MSKNLKRLLQNRAINADKIITPRIDSWLLSNDGIVMSEELAVMMVSLMTNATGGDRHSAFHASSSDLCLRRQMFTFVDLPGAKRQYDSSLQNKFNDGHWRHMRWQAMIMTAGILDEIEVEVSNPGLRFVGHMDGIGTDDDGKFGFELKGWSALVDQPKDYHLKQIQSYMMASGLDRFSLIYEHKSSQDWREFVIERDPVMIEEIIKDLEYLNERYEAEQLPDMLPMCKRERGDVFKTCPYRDVCVDTKEWAWLPQPV